MTGLPNGWASARLADIAEVRLGRQRSPKRATGDRMRPYLRAANVTWRGLNLSDVKEMDFTAIESESYELRPGDLLVAEASGSPGEVGKPAQYRGEINGCCFQNTLIRVRLRYGLCPDFYEHFFREQALNRRFAAGSRGVGIHHLGAAALSGWPVPVPPLPEQERIVGAVDEAFSKLDAGEAGLRSVRQLLKRMRDAILAAAVTGRLVPQEPTDTPATKLLAEFGVQVPVGPNTGLPDSWERVPLRQVADVRLGRQRSPSRAFGPRMRPYLRAANVGWDGLRLDDVKEMSFTEAESRIFELARGDLLLSEASGSPGEVGKPAQYRGEVDGGCCIQNTLIRIRLRAGLDPNYYEHFFRNEARTGKFAAGSRGVGIHHIGQKAITDWPVPVPPPEEQARMVAEIERLLSFVDACEHALDVGFAGAAGLRRTVLKAAFEGKLVPQDPSDEPASALLDRISAERSAAPEPRARRAKASA